MVKVVEKRLYWRLAGTLALLFVVVLLVLSGATVIAVRRTISLNVRQVQHNVWCALAGGASARDLTRYWSVGIVHGGVVLVGRDGRIVSTPENLATVGAVWQGAPEGFFDEVCRIDDMVMHVLLPSRVGYRRIATPLFVLVAIIVLALAASAVIVTRIVSRYVRDRDLRERTESLKLAADIQLGSMPQTFPPFPDRRDFDIFATIQPAKEVGGDFYDFYFAGPGRLVFLVADVSGKGVPAALFMMRARALFKGQIQGGFPLVEALERANEVLCEGNEASVFVTAWLGELDLATGRVTYVNAGHNPPVLRRAAGGADFVRDENPSLFLGALPGVAYVAHELQLASGDSLYLYTDGITEQVDARNELFGEGRLIRLLSETPLRQKQLLAQVTQAVASHAGTAEQSDDRTQLELVWRGCAPLHPSIIPDHP